MKKTLKIAAVAVAIFAILAALSLLYTYMKLQKVNLSVVNAKLYKESEITDVFEAAEDHTIYVFVYDSENEDCIYMKLCLGRSAMRTVKFTSMKFIK